MFTNLVKDYEAKGRVKLRGGQCEGRVEVTNENVPVNTYIPSKGKGAEYAARYRAEEERAYKEMVEMSATQGAARFDVTGGEVSHMEQLEELTSIGTVPNVRELHGEELTQVYSRYNFEPINQTNEHLKNIFDQREKIVNLIASNQVCIIKGPTGCGKSTQIPQFIMDAHANKKEHCNIVVTQPRRIAAINIAQRVCQERNWGEVGRFVGYQVGLDRKAGDDTRLLYCTTGVLLEKLIHSKTMNDYTHIILDEVHEREEDMDFLMLVVKKFLRTNSRNVKVVLMSATIDTSRFAQYFAVILPKMTLNAVCFTIEPKSQFTVQLHYLDSLEALFGNNLPKIREEEPTIAQELYTAVPLMIRAFNAIDEEDYKCQRSSDKKGAVLIFLPGLHQIETLHEILSLEDSKQKKYRDNPDLLNLWLCPLHSSITKDEQEKVSAYAPRGMRKVILSTNIAESSLTIPDVKYVIDFCLTKHLVADPNTGFTSLQMAWASHTNCVQRYGRVGRVQDGRVYRMVPKGFYEFKMPKESVPEMRRCPLEIVVLKCKRLLEEENPLRLISSALDPPDLDNYEKTILKLKEIGALLMTCRGEVKSDDGDLTFMGKVMGGLPLDIRITKLILLGHLFNVLEETIIMGCAMSVRNIFSEPFQQRLDAYNNKLLWADLSESDSIAYLTAYTVWRQVTSMGKFQRSKGDERSWGRLYMLQIKHLKEVAMQEDDIKKRLRQFNIETTPNNKNSMWEDKEKPLILKLALAGAFYPNYYSCNARDPNAEIEAVKLLGGHSPYNCVYLQNMAHPAPLYYDQVKELLHQNNISDNCQLYHDSSQKLIVEFKDSTVCSKEINKQEMHAEIPGDIVMPVYRAIKMRQLNTPLTINVYKPEMAKEKLRSLVLNSRTSMLSLNAQSSEHTPAIPWNQQFLEITVCHVENAGMFYGQILPSTPDKLRHVHHLLNNCNLLCKLSGEVEDGVIYAAPYKDEFDAQASYYRATITRKIFDSNNELLVDVFYIDYGNSQEKMPVKALREVVNEEVQKNLDSIPALAVKFVLAEVAPSSWNNTTGHWSKEANNYVQSKLTSPNGTNVWTTEIYSYINGIAAVKLFLQEEGKGGMPPLTLNQDLIQKGYAKTKEESYLSQRNHEKREATIRGDPVVDSIEENSAFKSLHKDLNALPFTQSSKVHLKGPHSPLEMKLHGKIKSSCQKEVRVEWNSVNSVLLDSEPSEPYEKLLVAGFVSQSSDGRRLLLNHTTVLPNLHGLAALVCLLFAPTIELRSDEYRSRYIGALCGLGYDPVTGRAYFPENDMEIKFDLEISIDDLLLINKVRYYMNTRFCGLDSEDMSENQIAGIKKTLKALFVRLLSTPRRPIKCESNPNRFKWNLINEDYLIPPFDESCDMMSTSIYNLFPAIDLDPKRDYPYIRDLVKKVKTLMESVNMDMPPREFVCELCDLDFLYWPYLRMHVTTGHHKQLIDWLKTRAAAHGLSLDPPKPALPKGKPPTTKPLPTKTAKVQPQMSKSRPSTSHS